VSRLVRWNICFRVETRLPWGSLRYPGAIACSVKMSVKNKSLMILAIILTATFASTMNLAMAQNDPAAGIARQVEAKPQVTEQMMEKIQERLDELDEAEYEERYNNATKTVDNGTETGVAPLWIARLHGRAWQSSVEAEESAERIGIIFAATKVKTNEYGAVYDVVWGIIGHDGERVGVKGQAVLFDDGVFFMKLVDDDLELYCIGLVGKAWYGVRLAMKGYMEHGGTTYGFHMLGRAYPIGFNWKRIHANK